MGLDMYVYKISSLTDYEQQLVDALQEVDQTPADISRFTIRSVDEEENNELLKHILPWMYTKTIRTPYFSFDKMRELIRAPKDAHLVMSSNRLFVFGKDDKRYELDISTLGDLEVITTYSDTLYGFCHTDQLCYWRKNYDLQEVLYNLCYEPIQNCGYYPLNDEMRKAIVEDKESRNNGYKAKDLKPTSPSEVICYHEWY